MMKRTLPITLIVILFTLCTTESRANIILKGKLVTDSNIPVTGTKIAVSGGPVDITDFKGNFQISLSKDFIEGERVIITVIKEGWVINHPLDGEWNLPNIKYQDVHITTVVIVPYGSKALWSHARIEKYIAKLSDELAKKTKEGNKPQPVDFSFYLKEWANQYGFTPDQVKTQFDQWAAEVKDSDNFRTLGLRAFYLKHFTRAAENFTKAALQGEQRRKALKERLLREDLATYDNWKDAGNAYDASYQFREALEAYRKAEKIATLDQYPRKWAEIKVYLGNAQKELGIRVAGEESAALLYSAVSSYRQALQRYTRQDAPQEWAGIQNNLGIALKEQGIRTNGVEGAALLGQAVQAYKKALEIRTKEHLPQDWASTQNNLGVALQEQGIRTGGAEGAALLVQAAQAYQKALEIRTIQYLPYYWAQTQNNLAELYETRENWAAAIKHYRNVYKIYPAYAANKLAILLHDRVFRFKEALEMNIFLLKQRDTYSMEALFRLVENYFTTGLYNEGSNFIQKFRVVLTDPFYIKRSIFSKIFEIANYVVLDDTSKAAELLENLIKQVEKLQPDFKLDRNFIGTKYFIRTNKALEPHREWLLSLFTAMEKTGRDSIVSELKKLRPRERQSP
jgi:tetratricopeptide (TPR) repeat protein